MEPTSPPPPKRVLKVVSGKRNIRIIRIPRRVADDKVVNPKAYVAEHERELDATHPAKDQYAS